MRKLYPEVVVHAGVDVDVGVEVEEQDGEMLVLLVLFNPPALAGT